MISTPGARKEAGAGDVLSCILNSPPEPCNLRQYTSLNGNTQILHCGAKPTAPVDRISRPIPYKAFAIGGFANNPLTHKTLANPLDRVERSARLPRIDPNPLSDRKSLRLNCL
jgi:hypothetical protein